jgi:aconitate hydratase 2/2-methylisocitrate dehydratase
VDEAAKVKAAFLAEVAFGRKHSPLISPETAVSWLGTMMGGYNLPPLIEMLDHPDLAPYAVSAFRSIILVGDFFDHIAEKISRNASAREVVESWANAEWFLDRPEVPEKITVSVFRVEDEMNTDDFSPAGEAWSRPDIPLHALSMFRKRLPGALQTIEQLKQGGYPVSLVGDVVGTGSSRKSATNSLLWHIGESIPFVPNKRAGGVCLGGKIAPIFFNTLEDAGALPIECDVSGLENGMIIEIFPREGKIVDTQSGNCVATFTLKTPVLLDEVRAGGRIPLIIGRGLTDRARKRLGLEPSTLFVQAEQPRETGKGYTLAQKIVGRACGLPGVRPGAYCEPMMTTVGSQDTTGPMTRDELTELACMKFSAGLVMQSFCHTAAYPKAVDVEMHHTLPDFITARGGVALRPGDGVIHSWLNRMILPDTVGTGGDSHTRFPIGISFPAGSGLVAFAAAIGTMPLDMPESVLVRFKGQRQPGITLRDLVNAIPWQAIQNGQLTVAKAGKKNVFSGRILEIEGLPDLSVEEAFELTDASAERSAAAATIHLNREPVEKFVRSNVALLRWMITQGYQDQVTLSERIEQMEAWLADPQLMRADSDAEYAEIIEIDLNTIDEPLVCCPNDPDDIKRLSEVAGEKIDEVFIGSCMTHIGHYRAAARLLEGKGQVPGKLWICPPTRMDEHALREEGIYSLFGAAGARTEMPGCSLCMGNQARVAPEAVVMSTSTRNFPDRIGDGAQVYLGSAELAAVCSLLGRLPDVATYREWVTKLESGGSDLYAPLAFDSLPDYAPPSLSSGCGGGGKGG